MMYYYRRKASPLRWLIVIIILLAVVYLGYWFYINYFSKIDFSKPEQDDYSEYTQINDVQELQMQVASFEGEVLIVTKDNDILKAEKNMVVLQGNNIKTSSNSQAILIIKDIVIRLNANSEIYVEKLTDKEISITQIQGRSYHKLTDQIKYQVKSLNAIITSTNNSFEVITNIDQQFLAVLSFLSKLNIEVNDDQGLVLASRIDPGEKALIDTQADKNHILNIEEFSRQVLQNEQWYKWNFDLDEKGDNQISEIEEEDQEPDFSITDESLELAAEEKETGVFLSWSVYHGDDFASYQLIRSQKNQDLKYPDEPVIKMSRSKTFNSFLDDNTEPGEKYYYRVCVVKLNDKVVCGNTDHLEIKEEEEIADTEPPLSPNLSISISAAGVNLNWNSNEEEDFKEYKILKSIINFLPVYPSEIIAVNLKGNTSYLDNAVNITSVGRYYYRVCSLDINNNYSCSNVKIIENGQVK